MKKLSMYLLAAFALLTGLQIGMGFFVPDEQGVDPSSRRMIVQGELVGVGDSHNTHAWIGVPYARPPVGEFRWKAARSAEPWQGLKETITPGNVCTQIGSVVETSNVFKWGEAFGSEDCLYLNLWAPQATQQSLTKNKTALPVMLWLHGGGNTSGSVTRYNMSQLAGTQQVVAVAINYRLGVMGWFSHPALRAQAETAADASGNYALTDMVQALKWIKENIAAFGGDPNNVTVFGESAGGTNVVTLLASPAAKGLFHRAIVQSGGVDSVTRGEAENYSDADEPGLAGSSSEVLLQLLIKQGKAAHRQQAKDIVTTMSEREVADYFYQQSFADLLPLYPSDNMGMYDVPRVIEDGAVLPNMDLISWFQQADGHNVVATIAGFNRDEYKLFLSFDERYVKSTLGVIKEISNRELFERHNRYLTDSWGVKAVVELANALKVASSDIWVYRFDWDEGGEDWRGNAADVYGASHGFEIPFILGDWQGLSMLGVATEENAPSRDWLGERMMAYWANFAYQGAPGAGRTNAFTEWQRWGVKGAAGNSLMVFDSESDGGVRMEDNKLHRGELVQRLKADTSISSQLERCKLYQSMFGEVADSDCVDLL